MHTSRGIEAEERAFCAREEANFGLRLGFKTDDDFREKYSLRENSRGEGGRMTLNQQRKEKTHLQGTFKREGHGSLERKHQGKLSGSPLHHEGKR